MLGFLKIPKKRKFMVINRMELPHETRMNKEEIPLMEYKYRTSKK